MISSWSARTASPARLLGAGLVCLLGLEVGLTVLLVGLVLVAALTEYLVRDRDVVATAVNERKAAAGQSVENMHGAE